MEIGFYCPVMVEEGRHIDNEIPEDRKVGKGFDRDRFAQEVFNTGSTGQDRFAIDLHGTGATGRTPTGITEREGSILLLLGAKQRLQQIHSLSWLQGKGFRPLLRDSIRMETLDS
jgi:hypothetical protein